MSRSRRLARLALAALAVCACAGPALAADPERDSFEAVADSTAEVPAEVDEARDELKEDLGSQGLLTVDDASGAVRFLAQLDGFLDSTPNDDPAGAARDYLADQAEVFGVERSDIGALRVTDQETLGGNPERRVHAVGGRACRSSTRRSRRTSTRTAACSPSRAGWCPTRRLETSDPDVSRDEALDAAAEGVAGAGRGLRRQARGVHRRGRAAARLAGAGQRLVHRALRHARGRRDRGGRAPDEPRQVRGAGRGVRQLSGRPSTGARPTPRSLTPYLDVDPDAADRTERARLRGHRRHRARAGLQRVRAAPGPGDARRAPAPTSSTPSRELRDHRLRLRPGLPLQLGPEDAARLDRRRRPGGHAALLLREPVPRPPGERAGDRVHGTDNFEGAGRVVAQAQDGADKQDVPGDTPGFPGAQHANNANMLTLPEGSTPGALMQMYLWDPTRDPGPRRGAELSGRCTAATIRRSCSTSTRTGSRTGW